MLIGNSSFSLQKTVVRVKYINCSYISHLFLDYKDCEKESA